MLKSSHSFWMIAVALMSVCSAVADEPQAPPTLKVLNERVCPGTISPYQYGQFIEYLCALTPSMFSEKLCDNSFEGVPPYRFAFRKETDRFERPWYPDGATNRGEYQLDKVAPFNGKVSQRIRQKPGDPATLGISQGGIYVKAGEPLRLSLYLRANDVQGPVKAAIWGEGKVYADAELSPVGRQWQKFEATLTATDSDTHATLTISFRGPGTLWIDQVSLMPSRNVCGWRTDVAECLKRFGRASFASAAARSRVSIGRPRSATRTSGCRLRPVGAGWNRPTPAWRSSSGCAAGLAPNR